jgi:hypothetical protein
LGIFGAAVGEGIYQDKQVEAGSLLGHRELPVS